MLKKIWRLFLGFVVCMGSACVTPTHASSAVSGVIFTHIQAGIVGSTANEMVALYNNTDVAVDITDWCIAAKSGEPFVCFESPASELLINYTLPPYSSAVVATQAFLESKALSSHDVTVVYASTHESSGEIVASSDTLTLVDSQGAIQDTYTWEKSTPTGKILQRRKNPTNENIYETAGTGADWVYAPLSEVPLHQVVITEVAAPAEPPREEPHVHPVITELLPNPDGTDTGKEFIELYNPSGETILLAFYTLNIGTTTQKRYDFPANARIGAGEYIAYSSADMKFTLLNSTGGVSLEYKGVPVGEGIAYTSPPDGQAWALVDDMWRYTQTPTPGEKNRANIEEKVLNEEVVTIASLKPCADNQYRHPETNRCRLIVTPVAPRACKAGQVRNPETNRCRTVATEKAPAACKEGQQRNPETNRCRTAVKMTSVDHGVKGIATQQTATGWYVWLGVAGVGACIVAYAAWEWRAELQSGVHWVKRRLVARVGRGR